MTPIRKALVVDDDVDVLLLCRVSLQTLTEWTISVAGSADAAMVAARRDTPDVILLDVMMPVPEGGAGPRPMAGEGGAAPWPPGSGGLTILRRLKGSGDTAQIPVVLMTAADEIGIDGCRALGAHGLIPKPFDPCTLPGEIMRIVGEGRPV